MDNVRELEDGKLFLSDKEKVITNLNATVGRYVITLVVKAFQLKFLRIFPTSFIVKKKLTPICGLNSEIHDFVGATPTFHAPSYAHLVLEFVQLLQLDHLVLTQEVV